MKRIIVGLAFGFAALLLLGCSEISTDYGISKGKTGRTSLNGFGALRRSYELAGYRSRDVSRLTDRVRRSDVIVWTPTVLDGIDDKVTRWFDRWLRSGEKTLVYIAPDSGSEANYWLEAAKFAPPLQRTEYRKRAAKSINERMRWRLNRRDLPSNGWFHIEPQMFVTAHPEPQGPWSADLRRRDDSRFVPLATEMRITPYVRDSPNNSATTNTAVTASGPTGPSSSGFSFPSSTSTTRSETTFRSVLKSADGDTIVGEVRSDDWKQSKIIVVAGGSLLTNYAFTHANSRHLASKIIAASSGPSRDDPLAGFLTSNWMPIPVSETKPGVPVATGMELLTVWPLSLVTMHGLMLGFIFCLMLWPVLGRPRRIRMSHHTDFGDHLDAVAGLMNRTGGEDYARHRISEYFKRIRGETSGQWVVPDRRDAGPTPTPLPKLTVKRTNQDIDTDKESH